MTRSTAFQLYAMRFAAIRYRTATGVPRGLQPPPVTALAASPTPVATSEVVIFSAEGCPYCVQAKAWFKKKGIAVTVRDVAEQAHAAEAKRLSSDDGVPVVQVGSVTVVGYDPQGYARALKTRG